MYCPNCHIKVPDASVECPKCSTVFADWNIHLEPEAPEPKKKISLLYPAIVAAFVIFTWWWLFYPTGGLPRPPGAFQHQACRFAVSTLPSWALARGADRPSDCASGDSTFGPPAGHIGMTVMALRMTSGVAVGHMRPVFMVLVAPTQIPVLTRSTRRLQTNDFWKAVRTDPAVASMQPRTSSLVSVDNITALRITGTMRLASATGDAAIEVFAVPGRGRTYILFWAADAAYAKDPRVVKSLEFLLESFRVTARPFHYGGATKAIVEEAVLRGWLRPIKREKQRPLADALSAFLAVMRG
ncbi:MAG: zinc ribbon domain-containing protein [Elusimicrobia bacterium]|nr:zinc ribbon domain-containing protein [Elusimicrobiota bacterium]